MKEDAINCVTIDDYQVNELSMVLDSVYGGDAHLGTAVIRNNPSGRSTVSGFLYAMNMQFFIRIVMVLAFRCLPEGMKGNYLDLQLKKVNM